MTEIAASAGQLESMSSSMIVAPAVIKGLGSIAEGYLSGLAQQKIAAENRKAALSDTMLGIAQNEELLRYQAALEKLRNDRKLWSARFGLAQVLGIKPVFGKRPADVATPSMRDIVGAAASGVRQYRAAGGK